MPLEIQDPNAQRASNTGVPGLQAQGQAVNQTAASLGQQDVTSATRTAQALGTLAQDLVGNAQQMQQKEAYVEAYANAGAGRSVAEIRAGEAPWESIFGPSATVQGAQARALQTAVASIGNDGLAMVDKYKDKDTGEFSKLLAAQVGKNLTGDSMTDTLITQKATELVPHIAAAQYKAHAKYTQELNLQTATTSIYTTLASYKAALAMDPDVQSEEGNAVLKQAVQDSLKNTFGMDPAAHRKLQIDMLVQDRSSGSSILHDMLMPELTPSVEQGALLQQADATFAKIAAATRKDSVDANLLQLAHGDPVDYPRDKQGVLIDLTDEEEMRVIEATEKGMEENKKKLSTERALGRVQLVEAAKNGAGLPALIKGIHSFESQYGTLDEAEQKEILGTQQRVAAAATQGNSDINSYLLGYENPAGEALYHMQLEQRYPGGQGSMLVLKDIAYRNEPKPNAQLSYEFGSNLGNPIDPSGKVNPAYANSFKKFQALHAINPEVAFRQITDPDKLSLMISAMEDIKINGTNPLDIQRKWTATKPVTERDIAGDTKAAGVLKEEVAKLLTGKTSNIPFYGAIKSWFADTATNGTYVRNSILRKATYITRNGDRDPAAAVVAASVEFTRDNENIHGSWTPNEGVPFAQQFNLTNRKVSANAVVKHYAEGKLKLKNYTVSVDNRVMKITPLNKGGITVGEPVNVPLLEMGNVYNTEVTAKETALLRTLRGVEHDVKLDTNINAIKYRAKLEGRTLTDKQAEKEHNRLQDRKHVVGTRIKAGLAKELSTLGSNVTSAVGTGRKALSGIGAFFKKLRTDLDKTGTNNTWQ